MFYNFLLFMVNPITSQPRFFTTWSDLGEKNNCQKGHTLQE